VNKKRKKLKIVFKLYKAMLILLSCDMSAQNLILNADFEKFKYCPSNFNQGGDNLITDWNQPNLGTVDYYNSCSKMVGVPKNTFGYQNAHSGKGYIGMVTYSPSQRNYREYLQAKLIVPLEANKLYCVEFYVSLGDNAMYVSDGIGIFISKAKIKNLKNNSLNYYPQITNPKGNFLLNSEEWILVSGIYKAEGGEEYLTIGNFYDDKKTKVKRRKVDLPDGTAWEHAYYFIDDIKISSVKTKEECSCTIDLFSENISATTSKINEVNEIQIKSLLFDFDQSELTEESKKQLLVVSKLLLKNPSYFLEIKGHTDIIGSDEYNLDLSKKRALKAIEFLSDKGISQEKLRIKYYGSTIPAANNENSEGRKQNRRVEFKVLQKKYEDIPGN
jgi:OmpA-OmpF porin, OOP family